MNTNFVPNFAFGFNKVEKSERCVTCLLHYAVSAHCPHPHTPSLYVSPQFINRARGEGGSKSLLDQIISKTVCSDIKKRRLTSSRNIFHSAWILKNLLFPYTFLLEVKLSYYQVCLSVGLSLGLLVGCRFRLSVIIFPKEREVLFPCSYRSTCLHNVPEHKTHIKKKETVS